MYLNRDPWVTITLNKVSACISYPMSASSNTAHITVIAPKKRNDGVVYYSPLLKGGFYSPVLIGGLPNEKDNDSFTKLYRILQKLVEQGILEGPWGEDHPAVFNRFEYKAIALNIQELLSELKCFGVDVVVKSAKYSCTRRVEYGEEEAKEIQLRNEVQDILGSWMTPEVEIIFDIQENPKPMTPEERAILSTEINEMLNIKPTLGDKLLGLIIRFLFRIFRIQPGATI